MSISDNNYKANSPYSFVIQGKPSESYDRFGSGMPYVYRISQKNISIHLGNVYDLWKRALPTDTFKLINQLNEIVTELNKDYKVVDTFLIDNPIKFLLKDNEQTQYKIVGKIFNVSIDEPIVIITDTEKNEFDKIGNLNVNNGFIYFYNEKNTYLLYIPENVNETDYCYLYGFDNKRNFKINFSDIENAERNFSMQDLIDCNRNTEQNINHFIEF